MPVATPIRRAIIAECHAAARHWLSACHHVMLYAYYWFNIIATIIYAIVIGFAT